MRERTIEKRLRDQVHKVLGGRCYKLGNWVMRGLPDRLVVLPGGSVYFIELKSPTGDLTPTQSLRREELLALSANHVVLRSVDEVNWWVDARAKELRSAELLERVKS